MTTDPCSIDSNRSGELITVVHRQDKDWWEGQVGERSGFFPSSYVQILPSEDEETESAEESEYLDAAPTQGLVARALYPYSADGETELSIKSGDLINLVQCSDKYWWEGEVGGKVGFFPSSYVTIIEDHSQEEAQSPLPSTPAAAPKEEKPQSVQKPEQAAKTNEPQTQPQPSNPPSAAQDSKLERKSSDPNASQKAAAADQNKAQEKKEPPTRPPKPNRVTSPPLQASLTAALSAPSVTSTSSYTPAPSATGPPNAAPMPPPIAEPAAPA